MYLLKVNCSQNVRVYHHNYMSVPTLALSYIVISPVLSFPPFLQLYPPVFPLNYI